MNNPDFHLIKGNELEDAWLDIDTSIEIKENPLLVEDPFFQDHPGLFEIYRLKDPEYVAYMAWLLCGIKMPPFQAMIQYLLWKHRFPMLVGCRGLGKTWSLAFYALTRALFMPDQKIVVAGTAFRQSQLVFSYIEQIWNSAPVLRSLCDKNSGFAHKVDRWEFRINSSLITAIPIGHDGSKVRGLRAGCVIADEFASHDPQIAEEVLFGFAATSADPVEKLIKEARKKKMKDIGIDIDLDDKQLGNQTIISGTADYYFNHFYEYFNRYKALIEAGDDKTKLRGILGDNVDDYVLEHISGKDFCVIRIPYEMLPRGFMDDTIIAKAKATMSKALYNKEYGAVFVEDSDGFFKRSIIDAAVANEQNIAKNVPWSTWCPEPFDAAMYGKPNAKYVIGVDPASEHDNFAIVVLELYPDHRRVVYSWTITKKEFMHRKARGFTEIDDFFDFCSRKIRELESVFPSDFIAIDTQGGGYALIEALHDSKNLNEGEEPWWYTINADDPQDTDELAGRHNIVPITFSKASWLSDANWGLLKDLEEGMLLFPRFDGLTGELSIAMDEVRTKAWEQKNPGKSVVMVDTLEDAALSIEELKQELTAVTYTRTGAGLHARDRWDVPVITDNSRKILAQKKDRYSALLMANSVAREYQRAIPLPESGYVVGGHISSFEKKKGEAFYSAPSWWDTSYLRSL